MSDKPYHPLERPEDVEALDALINLIQFIKAFGKLPEAKARRKLLEQIKMSPHIYAEFMQLLREAEAEEKAKQLKKNAPEPLPPSSNGRATRNLG